MTDEPKPKVIGLRGKVVTDGRTPRPDAVTAARDLLERVESGEVVGFAAVVEYYDGATRRLGDGVMSYALVGRMEQWKRNILASFD